MNSEKLSIGGESSAENTSVNEWESLAEFGKRLAAEKGMEQNQDRSRLAVASEKSKAEQGLAQSGKPEMTLGPANAEKQSVEEDKTKNPEGDIVLLEDSVEQPEAESIEKLTPQETAAEYSSLLYRLSANFTSDEAKLGGPVFYDENGEAYRPKGGYGSYGGGENRIVGQLFKILTGEEFRDARDRIEDNNGVINHEKRDYLIRDEWKLAMADDIISAESDWLAAGESIDKESELEEKSALEKESAEAKAKIDKIENGRFGKLKKALWSRFRGEEYNKLYNLANREPRTQAEEKTRRINNRMRQALEAAYGSNPNHYKDDFYGEEYADKKNEEYNARFSNGSNEAITENGYRIPDEETRRELIDRAVKLRRKLESEGLIKKNVHL